MICTTPPATWTPYFILTGTRTALTVPLIQKKVFKKASSPVVKSITETVTVIDRSSQFDTKEQQKTKSIDS